MGRWSPTIVAEAPRNAGMGLASFAQGAMGAYSALDDMRDRRRQRELQAQEAAANEAYRSSTLANDAARLSISREESKARQLTDNAELDLKLAQAGAVSDPNQLTGNAQAGSPVANAQAAKDESDTGRAQREAKELYPVSPVRFTDPRTGETRYIDNNAKARSEFLTKRMEAIAKEQDAKTAHQRALEVQGLRNKGQLDAARLRAANRGTGGSGGGTGKVDGVTQTQMTAELKGAQTAMAGLARRRGTLAPKLDPDNDEYDGAVASQWQQDSTITVDKFRPENNPRMAAALQKYPMPESLVPFMDTDPIPEREVQTRMAALTAARDRAKNPQARSQAQRLLNEYAQQVNQRGMNR